MNWFDRKDVFDTTIDVTPEMAAQWLERNDGNRRLYKWHICRLAAAMKAGLWRVINGGIAFSPTGKLLDGQHRLLAVIMAGVTVRMRVYFNQAVDTLWVIDGDAVPRDDADRMTLSGAPISKDDLSTLRQMLNGLRRGTRRSVFDLAKLADDHRAAIDFANAALPKAEHNGVAVSAVKAVLARAYYSCPHDKLTAFANMLRTCAATPEQDPGNSVRLLIKLLIVSNQPQQSVSSKTKYGKTEKALYFYLNNDGGEPMQKLQATPTELFPLPSEATSKRVPYLAA